MHKLLRNSLKMCAVALPLAAVSCGGAHQEAKIIEAPKVEIKDGMLTPEVLEALGKVAELTPSPDGKLLAFTLTYESIEDNKGNSEIYVIDNTGGEPRRLTKTAGSEGNIQWIDNGERIAFVGLDDKGEKTQIFSMKPDGSDRKQLSKVENGVESFKISPDGKKIVLASPIKPFNRDTTVFEGLDKTSGILVNDLMYKHWDQWVTELPHPFVGNFDGNEVTALEDIMANEPYECPMRPFGGAEAFAWSPDSKQLVYVSRKKAGMDYAFSTDSNLYLYNLETKKTEDLTPDNPGYDTDPVFSPDGKQLAWLSMATAKYESDKKRLMVMDMATRTKRDLTANWDYWPEAIAWSQDGKELYFNAYYQGTCPAFKINAASAEIAQIADGMWDYVNVIPTATGVYAMRHNMLQPNEIITIGDKMQVNELTAVNKEILSQLKEVKVEKRLVPTTDGKEMVAWVILPPDFDPAKKYPALLYCQGGPQQAVSQFWSYRWNFRIMAAHDYIVVAPARRGTPGFGHEWNHQISKDYPGQNMNDYLSAVDYMKKEPYVDGDHFGAIGASYGGFSVYYLAGHSDGRFAALVAHAGIFNMEAQYLETEEMFFADYDMGGAPWENANAIAQRTFANSPHKAVNNWTAPILVTVGELDYRILASQGMMAFNAAKMHGLEAEMLVFPDENHWVRKPQNAVLWQRVFFRFLDQYLKNTPAADPNAPKKAAVTTANGNNGPAK